MDPAVSFKEAKSLLCLFVVKQMCFVHERLSPMVTPRYFGAETLSSSTMIGPRREKTCLRGFRLCDIQTILLSYTD